MKINQHAVLLPVAIEWKCQEQCGVVLLPFYFGDVIKPHLLTA